MSDLKKYFPFAPTHEQVEALHDVAQYIVSPYDSAQRVYVLKGHAGTGKTSMVKALINYFAEYNQQFEEKSPEKRHFVLLASTGRAAKVLSEKTKAKVFTIHRQIYRYMPDDKEQSEDKIIFKLLENNNHENIVFIVDESSMIGNRKHAESYLQFGSGKTLEDLLIYTNGYRIIFVGDSAQLPPVNEKLSMALSPAALDEYFGINPKSSHLKQVMRFSANSAIFRNSQMVLQAILKNEFPEKYKPDFSGDDISLYENIEQMVDKYVECFNKDRSDVTNCVFVVSTNKLASEINVSIRNKIFKQARFLNNGEFLMVTKNNYKYDIMNGDTIKVISISPNSVKLPGLDGITFREITAGYGVEPFYTKFSTFIIEESLKSTDSSLGLEEEKLLLQNFIIRMNKKGIGKKSMEFVQELMKDPYLNALRVKYGYAVTGHKSQGGEWKDVFLVFQSMLFADTDKKNSYRWIYTTLTRASERLHVLKDIGYVGKHDSKNFKSGKLIDLKFSEEVVVNQQLLWKSSKGTAMCTLVTPTENLVLPQFKIKFNALRVPIFPATAVFENGYLIKWKK